MNRAYKQNWNLKCAACGDAIPVADFPNCWDLCKAQICHCTEHALEKWSKDKPHCKACRGLEDISVDLLEAHQVAKAFVCEIFCMADDPRDETYACAEAKGHDGDCTFGLKPWLRDGSDAA